MIMTFMSMHPREQQKCGKEKSGGLDVHCFLEPRTREKGGQSGAAESDPRHLSTRQDRHRSPSPNNKNQGPTG
ncbi:MAG: hypothetical protein AAGJ31_12355, partial [Verrucomicrobiota bacterium]